MIDTPAQTGSHASPSNTASSDTDTDTVLEGLALLFCEIEDAARSLCELVENTESSALTCVISDVLRLMSWRCDLGRRLADSSGVMNSTIEELLLRPTTAIALGLRRRPAP